jgi:hypothetical protein
MFQFLPILLTVVTAGSISFNLTAISFNTATFGIVSSFRMCTVDNIESSCTIDNLPDGTYQVYLIGSDPFGCTATFQPPGPVVTITAGVPDLYIPTDVTCGPPGSDIGGIVYIDLNRNGITDPMEVGYAGAQLTAEFQTAMTDPFGHYSFHGISIGDQITLMPISGYTIASENPLFVNSPSDTYDFLITPNDLGGIVWDDIIPNGIYDLGEPIFSGIEVTLTDSFGNNVTTTTDTTGTYNFSLLNTDTYTATVALPVGYTYQVVYVNGVPQTTIEVNGQALTVNIALSAMAAPGTIGVSVEMVPALEYYHTGQIVTIVINISNGLTFSLLAPESKFNNRWITCPNVTVPSGTNLTCQGTLTLSQTVLNIGMLQIVGSIVFSNYDEIRVFTAFQLEDRLRAQVVISNNNSWIYLKITNLGVATIQNFTSPDFQWISTPIDYGKTVTLSSAGNIFPMNFTGILTDLRGCTVPIALFYNRTTITLNLDQVCSL